MTSDYRKQESSNARKRYAWELLKQTRNPEYVSLRYGYPVEDLRAALEKIPRDEKPVGRSPAAESIHAGLKRASELVPETLRRSSVVEREPGCDDDLGE